MSTIVPPTPDLQAQTCREFLGRALGGYCRRPAVRMALGEWVCEQHANARDFYSGRIGGVA